MDFPRAQARTICLCFLLTKILCHNCFRLFCCFSSFHKSQHRSRSCIHNPQTPCFWFFNPCFCSTFAKQRDCHCGEAHFIAHRRSVLLDSEMRSELCKCWNCPRLQQFFIHPAPAEMLAPSQLAVEVPNVCWACLLTEALLITAVFVFNCWRTRCADSESIAFENWIWQPKATQERLISFASVPSTSETYVLLKRDFVDLYEYDAGQKRSSWPLPDTFHNRQSRGKTKKGGGGVFPFVVCGTFEVFHRLFLKFMPMKLVILFLAEAIVKFFSLTVQTVRADAHGVELRFCEAHSSLCHSRRSRLDSYLSVEHISRANFKTKRAMPFKKIVTIVRQSVSSENNKDNMGTNVGSYPPV